MILALKFVDTSIISPYFEINIVSGNNEQNKEFKDGLVSDKASREKC